MVYTVLTALYIIVCLLLFVVVLLQQGKGGDIAAAFGGSSSQTAFGARAGATVLTRATTILGALFMIGALTLTIIGRTSGGSSVVGGLDAPLAEPAPTLPGELPTVPDQPPAGGGSEPPAGGGSEPPAGGAGS